MSFHSDLMLQLRADLAQQLGLSAQAVYVGDRPQKVTRQGLEVWIEPQDIEAPEPGLNLHPYDVHVRLKARRSGSQTGEEQVELLKEQAEVVRWRYDGSRLFHRAVPRLLASKAEEGRVGEGEDDVLEGTVRVSFVEM